MKLEIMFCLLLCVSGFGLPIKNTELAAEEENNSTALDYSSQQSRKTPKPVNNQVMFPVAVDNIKFPSYSFGNFIGFLEKPEKQPKDILEVKREQKKTQKTKSSRRKSKKDKQRKNGKLGTTSDVNELNKALLQRFITSGAFVKSFLSSLLGLDSTTVTQSMTRTVSLSKRGNEQKRVRRATMPS